MYEHVSISIGMVFNFINCQQRPFLYWGDVNKKVRYTEYI